MKIVRTISECRAALGGGETGFVPTMGAFHEGHLELMKRSKEECALTVVSLYVNPTQFGPNEDLSRYPRDEDRDAQLASKMGADVLFAPNSEEIYQEDGVWVEVGPLAQCYEGAVRPGHFRGVATVVLKLFEIVRPNVAYFGLKDLQQCAVIRELVRASFLPINLRFIETVREPDGLAMSSRNQLLSAADRERAARLSMAIFEAAHAARSEAIPLQQIAANIQSQYSDLEFDYLDFVEADTFLPSKGVTDETRVIAAARVGGVRLIDNCSVKE